MGPVSAFLTSFQASLRGLFNDPSLGSKADQSSFTGFRLLAPLYFPGTIIADKIQRKNIGEQWEKMSRGITQLSQLH